ENLSQTITLNDSMVFLDQDNRFISASHGVRLLPGTYVKEAEDADYTYYRAPSSIEYRIFSNGSANSRFFPGGIYYSKARIVFVPAGTYATIDGTHKQLMWRLGNEFMRLRGSKWTCSGCD
ncbi:MAG TPA: hypothetical protein VKB71_13860, partial [Rhizomicrobium sp.]|nr:hypothetical protein [Rhizomicrobium sp.]